MYSKIISNLFFAFYHPFKHISRIKSLINKATLPGTLIFLCLSNLYGVNKPTEQTLLNKVISADKKDKPELFIELAELLFKEDIEKSLDYSKEALKYGKKINNNKIQIEAYHLMGKIFKTKEKYRNAIRCFENELSIRNQTKYTKDNDQLYLILAQLNSLSNHELKAIKYYKKCLEIEKENHNDSLIIHYCEILFRINHKHHRYNDAIEYFGVFLNYRDSLEKHKAVKEVKRQYVAQVEKKDKEIDTLIQVRQNQGNQIEELTGVIKIKEIEIVRKNLEKKLLITIIGAAILILVVLYIYYYTKKKANQLLMKSNSEIESQKIIIEEKNNQITDSIYYAQKIQKALLPSENKIKQLLPESFVLYKPKDIVSGDFYWIEQINNDRIIVTVSDCTGHGVPGGFLTMLGIEKLNIIINQHHSDMPSPSTLLNKLDMEMKATLMNSGNQETSHDGMDIAICDFDMKSNNITFSGANRPLWVIKPDGNLIELKPAKRGIGQQYENHFKFFDHSLIVNQGDMLYLFSDGYESQFGGSRNRKIMKKNLKKLLTSIHMKPPLYQKELLHAFFNAWKKEEEQIDDVLIMGIRIT